MRRVLGHLILFGVAASVAFYWNSPEPAMYPSLVLIHENETGALRILGSIPAFPVPEDLRDAPLAYTNLGALYHRRGDFQAASDNYINAIAAARLRYLDTQQLSAMGTMALAQSNLGGLLLQTGRPDDRRLAIEMFSATLRMMPHYGPSVLWLSRALNEDGHYSDAINLIDAALAEGFGPGFPFIGEIYVSKGIALCNLGFTTQAEQHFNYAFTHYPDIQGMGCGQEGF